MSQPQKKKIDAAKETIRTAHKKSHRIKKAMRKLNPDSKMRKRYAKMINECNGVVREANTVLRSISHVSEPPDVPVEA